MHPYAARESIAYLEEKLPTRLLVGAGELAADLGHLPLALAQAATYVADRDLTCAQYRTRLADQSRRLEEITPLDASADDYPSTVPATWSLSIQLADRQSPAGLARPLLELAAVCDPDAIPIPLLLASVDQSPGTVLPGDASSPDPDDLRDALHNLRRLSLASLNPGADTMTLHRLIRRAVREACGPSRVEALARTAVEALLPLLPRAAAGYFRPQAPPLAPPTRSHSASGPA